MIEEWKELIEKLVRQELARVENDDGSHDFGHLVRVSTLACQFAKKEKANELTVYVAGMMHDIVSLPKTHPEASKSSFLAAERAKELLEEICFPQDLIPCVYHAIHAHSFSANVIPKTGEAECVQDADRMEALGAFGIMRTFYCSGMFGSLLMNEEDPKGDNRVLDDKKYALDHFVKKLFTLQKLMKTGAGRQTAKDLSDYLVEFRDGLIQDHLVGDHFSGRFTVAKVFYEAGEKRQRLFDSNDPFCDKRRKIRQDLYPLDRLLVIEDPEVHKFINQLRFELNGYQLSQAGITSLTPTMSKSLW